MTLSSLSTSDYPELVGLCDDLEEMCRQKHVNLSLPSLRADNFSMELMGRLQRGRKAGLTFAPEAVGPVHVVDHPLDHLLRRAVPGGDGADCAVLLVIHVVEAGHIDPLDLGGGTEKAGLVPALRLGPLAERHHLRQQLLPLPAEGHVDEGQTG